MVGELERRRQQEVNVVEVSIPYGRRQLKFKLPASQVGEILELQCLPGVKDGVSAVRKAVCSPIGSPRLREIARPGKKITIVLMM